jgi:hypothetical protein
MMAWRAGCEFVYKLSDQTKTCLVSLSRQPGVQLYEKPTDTLTTRTQAQRATTGSLSPRVLNPAPLFLLGAGSRRGTHFLRKKQAA